MGNSFYELFSVCDTLAEGTTYEASEIYDGAMSLFETSSKVTWGDPGTLTLVKMSLVKDFILGLFEETDPSDYIAVRDAFDINFSQDLNEWVAIG